MVPTLRTTLGVKGHRPVVGNLDCHDVLYVFGALNLVTGRLTTRIIAHIPHPFPWGSEGFCEECPHVRLDWP